MLFASLDFIFIFLPLSLTLYFASGNKAWRNITLTLFSFIFYAWGEPLWIILLVFSGSVDFVNALLIERYRDRKKLFLVGSLVVQLGLLASFKYGAFICENINAFLGTSIPLPTNKLPIGISFYTFQTLSYVIDVYRGEIKAQKSYLRFLMYVSMFHNLVAGPIVRYAHVEHEINNRSISGSQMARGFLRFCFGLFKKVYFANIAGELVAQFLNVPTADLTMGGSWYGLLMYTLQIYFDFSGYSDMAIGLGWMYGFHYRENFIYPYTATSATDFWRKWHISLGSWFRDYLYIPLGGNRSNTTRNLLIVWFLTGLWHGASWNFILWGLYFGFLIWIERAFLLKALERIPKFISHVYLLFIAVLGWAIFYFTDIGKLGYVLKVLFGKSDNDGWSISLTESLRGHAWWLMLAVLFCMPVYEKVNAVLEKRMSPQAHFWVLASIAFIMFSLIAIPLLVGNTYNPFLYFRF
jgi:alginate O-acetyltransferase complex protein AlgI